MNTRPAGFYCLTLHKPPQAADLPGPYQWVIGYWNGRSWKLPGSVVEFYDEYFLYINENAMRVTPEIEAIIRDNAIF